MTITELKKKFPVWFSEDTMKFFRSKVESRIIAEKYFITSEQFDDFSPRLYTVRMVNENSINTVGNFQGFKTLSSAKNYIKTHF